jgi:hypothetical protein
MASSPSRASGGYTSYPSPAKSVPSQFSPSITIREAKVPNPPHPLLLPLKPTSHLPPIRNFVLQGGYAKGVVYDSVHGFSNSNPSVVVNPTRHLEATTPLLGNYSLTPLFAALWSCRPVYRGAEYSQATGAVERRDGRAELSRVEEVSRVLHSVQSLVLVV